MAFQFNHQQNDSRGQQNVSQPVEKKENPIDELKEYINSFLEDKQFDESESELILQKAAELQIDEDEVWDLMDAALNQSTKQPVTNQSSVAGSINPSDMVDAIKQGDCLEIGKVRLPRLRRTMTSILLYNVYIIWYLLH